MKAIKCICVSCGDEATTGSMQHPYCQPCFSKRWKDTATYADWLEEQHLKSFGLLAAIRRWFRGH